MPTPVNEIITFPEVEAAHQAGLASALSGNIHGAYVQYGAADNLIAEVEDPTIAHGSQKLHLARLMRDVSFLGIHSLVAGVETDTEDMVESVQRTLVDARKVTQGLLDAPVLFGEKARQRINAEHGATITCQARAVVYLGLETHNLPDSEVDKARKFFVEADEALQDGSSAYYGTSNAVRAAAFERVIGHKEIRGWLADAALFASTPHGFGDFTSSCRTLVSVGIHLTSREATRRATLKRP